MGRGVSASAAGARSTIRPTGNTRKAPSEQINTTRARSVFKISSQSSYWCPLRGWEDNEAETPGCAGLGWAREDALHIHTHTSEKRSFKGCIFSKYVTKVFWIIHSKCPIIKICIVISQPLWLKLPYLSSLLFLVTSEQYECSTINTLLIQIRPDDIVLTYPWKENRHANLERFRWRKKPSIWQELSVCFSSCATTEISCQRTYLATQIIHELQLEHVFS